MKAELTKCRPDGVTKEFHSYPAHKVLGVFDNPQSVKETLEDLRENGFCEKEIEVICNAGKIDFSGEEERLWGRIVHSFEHLRSDGNYLDRYEQELIDGRLLLAVSVANEEAKQQVREIFQSHEGRRLSYFGTWISEGSSGQPEKEFIPFPHGIRCELKTTFNDALKRTREALQKEGFGVLVDIDMKETLKEELGVDFRKYVILGACDPPLAYSALEEDLDIGMLLPCNVVVYESNGGSVIAAIDPGKMLSVAENPKHNNTAKTASRKLRRAIENLQI